MLEGFPVKMSTANEGVPRSSAAGGPGMTTSKFLTWLGRIVLLIPKNFTRLRGCFGQDPAEELGEGGGGESVCCF